ncbi:MAG TPA: J domain-containing protein [Bryobacteraceae bacterium]|nr:J domain-containing protein [Bryobacteraceae bacterium]
MNYYAVLGIAEDASSESIHNAFRALARQYHPDAGEGSSAGKFREVVEAYETLGDPARRQAYDRMLARERHPSRREAPARDVIVEPLAQPWFASTPHPVSIQFGHPRVIDPWFEEVFRSFDEFLSYPWFGRR